jgi:drug/metabolite transporter (DMT)-like permease
MNLSTGSVWLPIILAVGAGLCFGIGEVCTKLVLKSGQVGPVTAVAVRTLTSLPLVWAAWWLIARSEPDWTQAQPAVLAKLVLGAGLAAGTIALILFYGSLKIGDVSVVKPIAFSVAPATAVLLGWVLVGEAMTLRKIMAVAMILGGVVLLASSHAKSTAVAQAPATGPAQ